MGFFLLFSFLSSFLFLESKQPAVHMTVFVHGTYPALRLLDHPYSPFRKIIHAEPGLNLAKNLPENYHFHHLATSWFAKDAEEYNLEHFYMYGWNSGDIRPKNRFEHGRKLYEALDAKIMHYREEYEQVYVRLVGSSHGGNVLLNLLQWLPFAASDVHVELILLATPIQEATRSLVNSPYVDRTYSFYSTADWMQQMDLQRMYSNCPQDAPYLSQRTFLSTDKVIQIALTINSQPIGHFKYRCLYADWPCMLNQIKDLLAAETVCAHIALDYKK